MARLRVADAARDVMPRRRRPGWRRPTSRRRAATPPTRSWRWTPPATRSPPGSARARPAPATSCRSRPAPPGAGFSAAGTLSEAATHPQVAMTPAGEAVVAWWHFANPPGVSVLEVETRPAGGAAFSAPTPVKALPSAVDPRQAAGCRERLRRHRPRLDQQGPRIRGGSVRHLHRSGGSPARRRLLFPGSDLPVSRSSKNSVRPSLGMRSTAPAKRPSSGHTKTQTDVVVEAASSPPGGPFSAPVEVNPPLAAGENAVSPDVAADAAGDVTVVWVLAGATTDVVEAADRTGGRLLGPRRRSPKRANSPSHPRSLRAQPG